MFFGLLVATAAVIASAPFTMVGRGQSDGKSVGINMAGDGGNDGVIWECFMVVVSAVMVEIG